MPKKSNKTFESDLQRLAEIVEQVEDSQTPLDTAITLYKEGLVLAGKCGEVLRNYETEILTLQKSAEDVFTLEPFGASSTGVQDYA